MTEERKEKQEENYQFINEKIVPKRKKKWLKKLGVVIFVICMAILFGVVSQAVFLLSGNYLKEWLGIEEERHEVELPKATEPARITFSPTPKPTSTPTPTPTEVPKPSKTPTPEPTKEPDIVETPEPTVTVPPTSTPEPTSTPTPVPVLTENPEPTPVDAYLQLYESIRKVAAEVSDCLVTVEAIEQGVDWFQEVYEKRTRTTGLVLGNDGVDLLILVGTEQFVGATSIEVTFKETVISGSIYSMDREYGLAVIAVPLKEIPQEILTQVKNGVLADAEAIEVGMPVLALGAPNGYADSMEFGMITSLGSTVSVTDGEVAYFTTDIAEYLQGYGFVVNLKGEILGMITHTHKENPEDGIFSAVSLDSIRGVMLKLLNNAERAYFGIKGQDMPKNLAAEYKLEAGVYVKEVENASPALAAGIKAGDILVSLGGTPVEGIRSFSDAILECGTREIVQVKVLRKAEDGLREMTTEVSLVEKN